RGRRAPRMKAVDLVRFTFTSLFGHAVRSFLILLAMSIGVAGVVTLTWLGDAARGYVMSEFIQLGSHLIFVLPGKSETTGSMPPRLGATPRDLTSDDARALLRSPRVVRVAPAVIGNAPVAFGDRDRDATIIGSTPDFFTIRRLTVARGEIWHEEDAYLAV